MKNDKTYKQVYVERRDRYEVFRKNIETSKDDRNIFLKKVKICKNCGVEKDYTNYYWHAMGVDYLNNRCKACCNKLRPYNKEYYSNNRKIKQSKNPEEFKDIQSARRFKRKMDAVNTLGGKCSICGYDGCFGALDFHHKDGEEKDSNISWLVWKGNKKDLENELKKCVLLCANCHREQHSNEKKYIQLLLDGKTCGVRKRYRKY